MRQLALRGDQKRSPFIDYMAIVAMLFTFNTVVFRSVGVVDRSGVIRLASCGLLVTLSLPFLLSATNRFRRAVISYAGMIGLSLSFSLVVHRNVSSTVMQHAMMASALLFASSMRSKREAETFMRRYVLVMEILAIVSLFFFVFGTQLRVLHTSGIACFEWGRGTRFAPSYHGLHFETQRRSTFGFYGYRNTGIFVEAPMYNFVLCMALGLNALVLHGRRLTSLILATAVGTTLASTGFVSLLIMFGLYLTTVRLRGRILSCLRLVALFVLMAATVIAIWMVLGERFDTGSYSVRADHIAGSLHVFWKYFPFGCGYGVSDALFQEFTYDNGLTVGTAQLLARGGVFTIVLYLLPMALSFLSAVRSRNWGLVVFQLVFAWLVFVTTVCSTLLFWVFVWLTMVQYPILVATEASEAEETSELSKRPSLGIHVRMKVGGAWV